MKIVILYNPNPNPNPTWSTTNAKAYKGARKLEGRECFF